jgi:1-acyl-sn-glycerol-3-phosphate acyltransferase
LEKGRAIIALQGRGRIHPQAPHPYVSSFKPGTAIIAHNLYRDCGLKVPVTPLAMYGTQTLWVVPNQIRINVGKPMYVTDYLGGEAEEIVERFRSALENRVKALFLDLVKAR